MKILGVSMHVYDTNAFKSGSECSGESEVKSKATGMWRVQYIGKYNLPVIFPATSHTNTYMSGENTSTGASIIPTHILIQVSLALNYYTYNGKTPPNHSVTAHHDVQWIITLRLWTLGLIYLCY